MARRVLYQTPEISINIYFGKSWKNIFLSSINRAELLREIKSLNPKKACGADGIGVKIFLLCPDVFVNNRITLCYKALEIDKYPTLLIIEISLCKLDHYGIRK